MENLKKNYILILMASIFFMGLAATDIYIASLPEMTKEFDTTPNIVNLTISFFTFGAAVFVLFADIFSSHFGRRPIILCSIAVFSISSFLISFSSSMLLIIILRLGQSFIAFVFVVSRQVLRDIMNKREQVRANGIILAGLVISPAIAPVIGAYLSQHFGWRSCFVFIGIVGVILFVLTLKVLPETNSSKLSHMPKLGVYLKNSLSLFNSKYFVCITLIYVSATAAFYGFIGISSYLYIDNLGLSPIFYSYIYIFMAGAYLLGNQYLLFLNKREISYSRIITLGVYSTLAGALVIMLSEFVFLNLMIIILITAGSMFMRAANALTNPTTQVITLNHFEDKGGIALGVAMSINSVMMGVSVVLVTLFHKNPLIGLSIVTLIFAIIGLVAFYIVHEKISEENFS